MNNDSEAEAQANNYLLWEEKKHIGPRVIIKSGLLTTKDVLKS